ncbi:MAG: hypothetical protein JW966_13595 [Anaerolineae bacterium]|nr:hypothetical protein [Anaerolineae bacterium]
MSQVVIVDNEYITIEYLPDHKTIHHIIHQPFGGQPFRDALNLGTEALGKYGVCKWLSDDRKNGPLSPEDANWGFNDWNRRTIKAGWKYWAVVVPEELVAAGTLIPTIENLFELGLRMMVFSSVDKAMEWLDKQEC